MSERYVLLGLAPARSTWFSAVGQWATSAALPAEFVRCVSPEELRVRLASGRRFSTALLDGSVPGVDRDLVATARDAGCAVVVVADNSSVDDWRELGAMAVIAPPFSRDELLEVLTATSSMVAAATVETGRAQHAGPLPARGRLLAVTGPGGTGASMTAIALAQGLANGTAHGAMRRASRTQPENRSVLLADLCRAADQAMLHDSRVLVPGVQEVVDAHRSARPDGTALLEQSFEVAARGYRLLLGLRHPRQWAVIRPQAFDSSLESLQQLFDVVVADVDPDVEGEAETGSIDVEERNHMSRATLSRADAVLVVGEPSIKGIFSLVRTLGDLLALPIAADRLMPVICRAPRSPRRRAELTRGLSELLVSSAGSRAERLMAPLYLPAQAFDDAVRRGVAVPGAAPRSLARAAEAVLDRTTPPTMPLADGPVPVRPGSLSGFTAQDPPRP